MLDSISLAFIIQKPLHIKWLIIYTLSLFKIGTNILKYYSLTFVYGGKDPFQ
jgi:hypothetical protein